MKTSTFVEAHGAKLLFIALLGLAAFALILLAPRVHAQIFATMPLCEISRDLALGSTGEDVRCLQRYLNWAEYPVAITGPGSPGFETAYYGPLTAAAVTRWQNANAVFVLNPIGLYAGNGHFGATSLSRYVTMVRGALGLH